MRRHHDGAVVHTGQGALLGQPRQRRPVEQQVSPRNHDELGHLPVPQQFQALGGYPLHQGQVHNQVLRQFDGEQPFREMEDAIGRLIGERVGHGSKVGRKASAPTEHKGCLSTTPP